MITRGQQSVCLRSKTVTALVASQQLSGLLNIVNLAIVKQCYLTYLAVATFQPKIKENMRFAAEVIGDLILVEAVLES